eukprot:5949189-Prymnesium_polylepis.2
MATRQIALGVDASSVPEVEDVFEEISHQAADSASLVKLLPLSIEARERYLVQVLTERFGYSGDAASVPHELFNFMSGRAAGNPKFIEVMLKALFDAKAVSIESDVQDSAERRLVCGDLSTVTAPAKMKATLLQQYDSLPMGLQVLLKKVSPLQFLSEAMVMVLGLDDKIVELLSLWLAAAVDEGLLCCRLRFELAMPAPRPVTPSAGSPRHTH